jgi:hypothetical protein
MSVKKWKNNLILLSNEKKVGSCPFCRSLNTDYCFILIDKIDKMGYGVLWCNDCKHGFIISRTGIPSGFKYINADEIKNGNLPYPKDIIL